MAANNVTPVPRDTGIQRGVLPSGLKIEVDWWLLSQDIERRVDVKYMGSLDALIADGVLTPAMLQARSAYRRGDPQGLNDGQGIRFNLHRAATRSNPQRWRLVLSLSAERAFGFPGVRELFPRYLAAYTGPIEEAARARPALRLVVDNTRPRP